MSYPITEGSSTVTGSIESSIERSQGRDVQESADLVREKVSGNSVEEPLEELEDILIEVKNLKKYFPIKGGVFGREVGSVKAVDGVSFRIKRGETLGLVGESGCGKTTLGRLLLNLIPPTSGELYFDVPKEVLSRIKELEKKDMKSDELKKLKKKHMVYNLSKREMRKLRKEMQIVFQDPYSSLNPRMLVKDIVGEPIDVHKLAKGEERTRMITELLGKVGLNPEHMYRYPHEFSGGQRQRIGIARALALKPKLLVLDEPTSALDVSVQAQILNLLQQLQRENNLTYVFISHHLSVIRHMADRVAVMYLGKIVEIADTEELFDRPMHPYTQALLSAIPVPDPITKRERIILEGDVPSPANPPLGCRFHTRCRYAKEQCGWSADEVIEMLKNKIKDANLKCIKSINAKDKKRVSIVCEGVEITSVCKEIMDICSSAKEVRIRALSLSEPVVEGNKIVLTLPKEIEPELEDIGRGHYVACPYMKGQEKK